jgi:hypothetical protein
MYEPYEQHRISDRAHHHHVTKDLPKPDHSRIQSRSLHRQGRKRLFRGDLDVRILSRRTNLPFGRSCQLDLDRSRAVEAFATRHEDHRAVRWDFRSYPTIPREAQAVLHDDFGRA